MEIYAKSKYDYETVKALAHTDAYKRFNPKKTFTFWTAYSVVLIVIMIVLLFLWGSDRTLIILLPVCIAVLLLDCFIYWGLPKVQYKSLGKMANMENEFVFYEDVIKITSNNMEYSGEAELKYTVIPKVMETTKYLFVFQTKRQVYAIDKSTITNGTMEDIRRKLKNYVNNKYIMCRY